MAAQRGAPEWWDIYTRLSVADDTGDLEKVETQEEDCRAEASSLKIAIGLVHSDPNKSAWKRGRKRPGWDAMLVRIRAGAIAGVLAYHDDRLVRHPKDLEDLLDASDYCEDTHGFGVVLNLSGIVYDLRDDQVKSELRQRVLYAWREVANTKRRVLRKRLADAKKGRMYVAKHCYGYQTLSNVPNPPQAAIIREVAERFLDKGNTWTEIADDLNMRGERTLNGALWTRPGLRQMMSHKRHGGVMDYEDRDGKARTDVPRPEGTPEGEPWPVLDTVTFDRLQAVLATAKRGRMRTTKTLLSGIAKCGKCGIYLVGASNTGQKSLMPDGTPRATYRCPKDRGGCSMAVTAAHVDSMVRVQVIEWYAVRGPELEAQGHLLDSKLEQAKRHLASLERNYASMLAKLTLKGLPEHVIEAESEQVERAVDRQRAMVNELRSEERTAVRVAENAQDRWDNPNTTTLERRRMVEAAIKSIVIQPAKAVRVGTFDTSRIEIEVR